MLDDPALLSRRETFWAAALTDPRYKQNTAAVTSSEGDLIGIAMAGSVISRTEPAGVRVADPNPRGQAFYRKNGFVTDGAVKIEDDVWEVRMVRTMQAEAARKGSPGEQLVQLTS